MTAKDFVLQHKPTARSEKQVQGRIKGMQRTYYLIREQGKTMYFSSGDTESKAWKAAKERILEILAEKEEQKEND